MKFLLGALFLAVFTASSVVVWFCLGALVGRALFGSLGGHGLGDLGYLFGGAFVGLLLGLGFSVFALVKWEPSQHLKIALGSLGGAGVAAMAAVIADQLGAW